MSDNIVQAARVPSSIAEYRRLGYEDITYLRRLSSRVISTKIKRLAQLAVSTIAGLVIPKIGPLITAYDFYSAAQTQTADAWFKVELRNILAKTPRGYETIIGQEVVLHVYFNKSLTKHVKTIRKTYWTGG